MPTIRTSVVLLIFAVCLSTTALDAGAQHYPAKPIRFIVSFTAGGGADATSRMIAPKLAETLGPPVVVEDRGGAGGTNGVAIAARAAPDGYTVALGTSNIAAGVSLFEKLTFDPPKDCTAVSLLARTPDLQSKLIAEASIPVGSVPEQLAAYFRSEIEKWTKVIKYSGARSH